jgi:DNA-directed RNA polymerase specialized sigma24 family protein
MTWELNREALEALLAALAPDRAAAAHAYEVLRARLVDLFTWERFPEPEVRADETLNRFARRAVEGEKIVNPYRYAHGIARMVMLETVRNVQRERAALRELRLAGGAEPESQVPLETLRRCLAALPARSRKLIEQYYLTDRVRMAEAMGISINALRNRAQRIRERLYDCVMRRRDES